MPNSGKCLGNVVADNDGRRIFHLTVEKDPDRIEFRRGQENPSADGELAGNIGYLFEVATGQLDASKMGHANEPGEVGIHDRSPFQLQRFSGRDQLWSTQFLGELTDGYYLVGRGPAPVTAGIPLTSGCPTPAE